MCGCGKGLPSRGATRCPQCRAAHARLHIGSPKSRAAKLARLPAQAGIAAEIEWVAANLGLKRADPTGAPSLLAVNLLADVKKDERLRRNFWGLVMNRRLSPGDRKHKPSAFRKDNTEDRAAHDRETHQRLFGDMGRLIGDSS